MFPPSILGKFVKIYDGQTHGHTDTLLYITRISGLFTPFILVGSALCLRPPALGMDRVEQVVGVGVAVAVKYVPL